jgi:hypothetical protein
MVGSEDTFDIEFPTVDARDIFTLKTRQLIRAERSSGMDPVFGRSGSGLSSNSNERTNTFGSSP